METDPLTTLDEFGSRKFVIPAEVKGPFRNLRNGVYFALVFIFLALPWIQINGLQAVLLDIPGRRFEIFGQLFLAHDAPLLFLILAIAVLMLAFVTAMWGRVWCGWACPQTVFIDGIYRRIEIWVEGDYMQRRKLREKGPAFERGWKTTLKWFLYFAVSSVISHSVLAYFTGSSRLIQMIEGSPTDNWWYFVMITAVTLILMFNFGWFREQFCTIMCPYGRFQSVLMDGDSLTVLYDEKRGEPRKGKEQGAKRGACVSCNRCVQVCPVAIDIRKGLQMECIACTACIDACDEIMDKVKQPRGLIRYQSVNGRGARLFRPRVLVYLVLALICATILSYQFATHATYAVNIFRGKDIPYQTMTDGSVLNHFKAHVLNQSHVNQNFTIQLAPEAASRGITLTQSHPTIELIPGQGLEVHLFVTMPQAVFVDGLPVAFIVTETLTNTQSRQEIHAVGPKK